MLSNPSVLIQTILILITFNHPIKEPVYNTVSFFSAANDDDCHGLSRGNKSDYKPNFNHVQIQIRMGSMRSQMFFKKGALTNFTKFTEKHLCWSLFLIKLQA